MIEHYTVKELEDTADEIIEGWNTGITSLSSNLDFLWDEKYRIGTPDSLEELEEVARISCLNNNEKDELRWMLEDEHIHYGLISLERTDEIDGYIRSYDIERDDVIIRAVATAFADNALGSVQGEKGFKLALAQEYRLAEDFDAQRFGVAAKSIFPRLTDEDEYTSEAELLSNPLKSTFDVEYHRRSIPVNSF